MVNALVAGGTGMLGARIAHHLLNEPAVAEGGELRLLVRTDSLADPAKKRLIDALVDQGAVIMPGDLHDDKALTDAASGMDVVVSAVQGGRNVIVDGQVNLARAAERAGARRFVPSDFAIDLFKAPPGALMFDPRREADEIISALDLDVMHVLTGGFLDMVLDPRAKGIVDANNATVTCWGTGEEPFNMTTVDDTARLTACLVLDDTASAGVHMFAAAETSPSQLAEELSKATGRTFTLNRLGSVDDLRAAISRETDPGVAFRLWYMLSLATTPPFAALENDRYPDIELTTLSEQLRRYYGDRG
ncbi:NmrA family NAD(P)-binding protein [Streptomyces sp. NPDC096311]|uniref:NmrA family NAD(P)-binding protein n=1 Tax=Streptomyces sp. NPDC096311 TaxID=3366083 RepID=UPI003823D46F